METLTLTRKASPDPGMPGGPEVLSPTGAGRCGGLECTQGNDLTVCFVFTRGEDFVDQGHWRYEGAMRSTWPSAGGTRAAQVSLSPAGDGLAALGSIPAHDHVRCSRRSQVTRRT